ncbi:hypothetical protein [Nocardia sp. NPDC048505]|uniref:hypothetical protein n=1 Tax=unclassified Nocardia TaxID=2637762 RepID=UPI0033F65653
MPQTRESALQNRAACFHGERSRAVHLLSRVAPGLSDASLAELASVADELRSAEGLPPAEFTAQW